MSVSVEILRKPAKIALLGVSFDTSNLGVKALSEGSIKCILHRWPEAEIILLGAGRIPQQYYLKIKGRQLRLEALPVRFCKNIFLPNHFCVLALYAILRKLLPGRRFRSSISRRNQYFEQILATDLVLDITGGDSFSDIYGMRRYILDFLRKWLVLQLDKRLILLPQTYGPFQKGISRSMARYVIKRATAVYSRDRVSIEYVRTLMGKSGNIGNKMQFVPDVAFVLDPQKPGKIDTGDLEKVRTSETMVVGLNVSGLLYHGGYTQDNMFGLKCDYHCLIDKVIDLLMEDEKVTVLLVPHVFDSSQSVESDSEVCQQLYENMPPKYRKRIFLTRGEYNQNEIKYVIGQCDFFIGSRMHACIAALSQGVPAVGLAYSKKFYGVFQSVGLERYVLDLCCLGHEEILTAIRNMFKQRAKMVKYLAGVIPEVQKRIINILNDTAC